MAASAFADRALVNGTPRGAGFRHPASIPCGVLRCRVQACLDGHIFRGMHTNEALGEIVDLAHHADAETLREFDHPEHTLFRWKAALTAVAWVRDDLACFFVGANQAANRYVLMFERINGFRPLHAGHDMTTATIGHTYDLDVLVTRRNVPCVERAEKMSSFP